MRYNSTVYPACAATTSCNAIGNMYLTSHAGLANLHGRNDLNENDLDENVSVGAIVVCWANAGYIGGNSGSWISSALLDHNQGNNRVIEAGAPIYNEFNFGQRQRLLDFMTGPNANEYGILRCFVAELVREDDTLCYVTTSPHFIPFFRITDTENVTIPSGDASDNRVEWIFLGGERGSRPLRVKHCNVFDLFCTNEGRFVLEDSLSEPYGEDGKVTFIHPDRMANPTNLFGGDRTDVEVDSYGAALDPDKSFIVLPKVQLRSRDVISEEETITMLKNRFPWTVISNTGANSNKMHTIQVIDGVRIGHPHSALKDIDNELSSSRRSD